MCLFVFSSGLLSTAASKIATEQNEKESEGREWNWMKNGDKGMKNENETEWRNGWRREGRWREGEREELFIYSTERWSSFSVSPVFQFSLINDCHFVYLLNWCSLSALPGILASLSTCLFVFVSVLSSFNRFLPVFLSSCIVDCHFSCLSHCLLSSTYLNSLHLHSSIFVSVLFLVPRFSLVFLSSSIADCHLLSVTVLLSSTYLNSIYLCVSSVPFPSLFTCFPIFLYRRLSFFFLPVTLSRLPAWTPLTSIVYLCVSSVLFHSSFTYFPIFLYRQLPFFLSVTSSVIFYLPAWTPAVSPLVLLPFFFLTH